MENETPIIDMKNLPDYLANHPFVQNACKWPEKEQRALNGFLQDIAYLIKDRDNLRMSGTSRRCRMDLICRFVFPELVQKVDSLVLQSSFGYFYGNEAYGFHS